MKGLRPLTRNNSLVIGCVTTWPLFAHVLGRAAVWRQALAAVAEGQPGRQRGIARDSWLIFWWHFRGARRAQIAESARLIPEPSARAAPRRLPKSARGRFRSVTRAGRPVTGGICLAGACPGILARQPVPSGACGCMVMTWGSVSGRTTGRSPRASGAAARPMSRCPPRRR
jgi:hypothetical protein